MRQRANPFSLRERASAFPSVSVFHFFLNSNQSCLSPHHHPVISTNTNPTAPAQYPTTSPNQQTLSESLISPYVKNKPYICVGRESISARSVESLTVRYREEGGRKEGGLFDTSVFPSVACCLFDFVLSQDKH